MEEEENVIENTEDQEDDSLKNINQNKNHKKRIFLKYSLDGLNLKTGQSMIKLALFLVLIAIPQIYFYLDLNNKIRVSNNLVKVYGAQADYYALNYGLHTFTYETVVWNLDKKIWNQDPQKSYNFLKDKIINDVLPICEESKNYDMGEFTKTYRELMNVNIYLILESSLWKFPKP